MISYLAGKLRHKAEDRVVVEVGGLGYEVLLPAFVRRTLEGKGVGEEVEFQIYYYASERSPRPLLIGFNKEHERSFFEEFIKVSGIGPLSASKALVYSVSTVARAIEAGDVALLRRLDGVGARTAEKIVAALRGKVGMYALLQDEGLASEPPFPRDLESEALQILQQLGYRRQEAQGMVRGALQGEPLPRTAEELIQRIYQRGAGR